MFELDPNLKADTFEICDFKECKVLAMNNSTVPWIIVVPKFDVIEWYQLDPEVQKGINGVVNKISVFLKQEFHADKLNIASLGNVVSQLHIHVIARFKTDPAWPNPVWGNIVSNEYSEDGKRELTYKLSKYL